MGKRRRPLCYRPPAPLVQTDTRQTAAPNATNIVVATEKRLPSKSSKITRATINHFHVLLKALHAATTVEEKQKIQAEIDQMGGLRVYQQASLLGQSAVRGGDTSRWLLPHLRQLHNERRGVIGDESHTFRLRLLDVGALKMNYEHHKSWIDCTAIDLNSQQPERILRIDFMELSPPEQEGRYDILCLSLVLNFVPSPELRGKMLKRINLFLRQSSGRLFIVLPLACVCNSRYMTDNHFRAIMTKLGYQLVENHFSNKLAYYLFQLVELSDANIQPMFEKKRILVEGANRNNFAIIL